MKRLALFALLGLVSVASSKFQFSSNIFKPGNSIQADNEDASLTVPQLIEKYGYPVEVHYITTEDGYILQAHRIPYSPKCGPSDNKRVVWVQHGLLGDSSNYVIAGPEKALAYKLADECYDVWLGNYRGSTYGRNHTVLHPFRDRAKFWAYSWNELGLYDIPADIDYVLKTTGVDQIYYIGHSMGTTGFWITMSEKPEYNSKIKLMVAHAPVAFVEHMYSPIALIAPFSRQVDWLSKMTGVYELLPSNAFMELMGKTSCHQKSLFKEMCANVLFLLVGWNSDQLDRDMLPTILGHVPAGSSVRNIVHFGQGVMSGNFQKFDYGEKQNLEEYGTPTPPQYDLSKITAPVGLFWGANDPLAVPSDVFRLSELLPNLQMTHRVNHSRYNHLDFLWAKDNNELINTPTIEFMKSY